MNLCFLPLGLWTRITVSCLLSARVEAGDCTTQRAFYQPCYIPSSEPNTGQQNHNTGGQIEFLTSMSPNNFSLK